MRTVTLWCVGALLTFPSHAAHARVIAPTPVAGGITGRITDKDAGTPIAGVSVTVVGTKLGTVTDDQGRYRIAGVPDGPHALTAQRIGYAKATQQVTVPAASDVTADFALSKMTVQLGEIVVTATGNQRKIELGNEVATLRPDSVTAVAPITNITDMLQGRVAGLMTFANSGVTGSTPRIRIRGFNSLSQPNAPLMVIDGTRVDNSTGGSGGAQNVPSFGWTAGSVMSVNPEEIESIEIVKGPSAATLYGTDAANGVIVIRTKRGQQGATKVNVYGESGVIPAPTKWNTNYYAFGHTTAGAFTNCTNLARAGGLCAVDSLSVYDAMKDSPSSPLGTGTRHQGGLQVSGGVQQFRYFFSGDDENEVGYLRLPQSEINRLSAQRGGAAIPDEQIHPNYLHRVSLRGNASSAIGSKTEINISNGLQFQKSQIPTATVFSDAAWGPGYKDAFEGWSGGRRPGEDFAVRSAENLTRVTSSVNAQSTPVGWLDLRGTFGVDGAFDFSDNLQKRDEGGTAAAPSLGRRNETRNQTVLYSGDIGATGTFNLRPSLTSKTSIGGQFNRRNKGSVTASGTNLPPGSATLAGAVTVTNTESTVQSVVAGGYIEEMLGFRDRLFVTAATRADGASSFGKNFKTAYYPKVGLSWLTSDEGFFPKNDVLTSLRYRLAYGSSGVQPSSVAALANEQLSTVFLNGTTASGAKLLALGNPNLKPEKTSEIETGVDVDFFSGRVHAELSVYQKDSKDALVQRAWPRSVGVIGTGQLDNVGAVRNRGQELSITAQVFDARGVAFQLSANGSLNHSVLKQLDPSLRPPEDRFIKFVPGYPLMGQWDHALTGFSDKNGNGIIEPNEVTLTDSVVYLGVTNPTDLLNISPSLSFFHEQLRFTSMFVHKGGYIQTNFSEANKCNIGGCRAKNDPNAPLGVQASYIALSGPTLTYAGYAENGTFTRWAEASIVWDARNHLRRVLGDRKATLTLSARNLKLWTKYTGLDPEVAANPELGGNFGTLWDLGYDNPVSPQPRYFILRLTLGL